MNHIALIEEKGYFFDRIIMNFKKYINIKIIGLIVYLMVFPINNNLSSYHKVSYENCLRVPSLFQQEHSKKLITQEYPFSAEQNEHKVVIQNFIEMKTEFPGYDANVHDIYGREEQAILQEQRRLSADYDTTSELLVKAIESGNQTAIDALSYELSRITQELKIVISARKKFICLGIPAYHSHTNLDDDGKLKPEQLVDHAIKNGITVLYVTGHNRITGSKAAMQYAKSLGYILDMRPAVEIDAPFIGASSVLHVVIMTPDDENIINEVGKLTKDNFDSMQKNFQWRFKAFVKLGEKDEFNQKWNEILEKRENELKEIAQLLFEKEEISDNSLASLKKKLQEWFETISQYADKHPGEFLDTYLNKTHVPWRMAEIILDIDKPEAGIPTRTRAIISFSNLMYSDENVEVLSGTRMMRAEEISRKVTRLGCRVAIAHLGFELYLTREISDEEAFKSKVVSMIKEGILHSVGAAWDMIDERGPGERFIESIRNKAGISYEDFPTIYNIPDYHGKDDSKESISKGILHKAGTKQEHWTWSDSGNPPDIENYFRDGKFLINKILPGLRKDIGDRNYRDALSKLKISFATNPYSEELLALMGSWFFAETKFSADKTSLRMDFNFNENASRNRINTGL